MLGSASWLNANQPMKTSSPTQRKGFNRRQRLLFWAWQQEGLREREAAACKKETER